MGDDRVAGSQRFNLRRTVVRIVTCDCVRSRCTPGNRCCGWQCRTSNCICVLLRAAIDRKYPWSRGNWSASRPDCRGLILGNRIRLERKLSHRIPCVFRTEPGRRSSSELIESTDSSWPTTCRHLDQCWRWWNKPAARDRYPNAEWRRGRAYFVLIW